MAMTYGDGTAADVGPGEFLLGEDTHGRGHVTRARAAAARLSIFAHLAADARVPWTDA